MNTRDAVAVTFIAEGQNHGRALYEGHDIAAAKRAAAGALGYRDIRSAYSYLSEDADGNRATFYCRRRESAREDFDVVRVRVTP